MLMFKVVITFESAEECMTIQMKATKQCFPVSDALKTVLT